MDPISSLYKSGNDWILNGNVTPPELYRMAVRRQGGDILIALRAPQSGVILNEYALLTDIDKNATGDKYTDLPELRLATDPFFIREKLATGFSVLPDQLPGYSRVDKFGFNPLIATTTDPEDIWEGGGTYNYDAFGSAPIQYLSSSDNGDIQDIRVQGLDINGDEVFQTVALTGQTVVVLPTPLWRVYRMENQGNADFAGTVYCHTDPTPTNGVPAGVAIRALIDNGNNQTLMALYTIPKGKVAFLQRGEAGMVYSSGSASQNVEFATMSYQSRRLNKIFKIKKVVSLMSGGNSNYEDRRIFPDVIPALTDIKMVAKEVSNDMGIWATFDILLVDEENLSREYLQTIEQPGY